MTSNRHLGRAWFGKISKGLVARARSARQRFRHLFGHRGGAMEVSSRRDMVRPDGEAEVEERLDSLRSELREISGRLETIEREMAHAAVFGTQANELAGTSKAVQLLLLESYRERIRNGRPVSDLAEAELRVFSQNGEDGILLYLFELCGTTNKVVVELCAGDARECNAANLVLNHRWAAYLFDGDANNVSVAQRFFAGHKDSAWEPPTITAAWLSTENVNQVVEGAGISGEIDLLSLDMDSVDYWIWDALTCVNPRVVVAEFNWIWGTDRAMTIPNDPDSVWTSDSIGQRLYYGASLRAMTRLAASKGYRLVGCDSWGCNAFFVRNDVGGDLIREIDPSDLAERPTFRHARRDAILDHLDPTMPWVEV